MPPFGRAYRHPEPRPETNVGHEGDYRYPFSPYPSGWFRLAFSDEVGAHGVRRIRRFGRELELYRSTDGQARLRAPKLSNQSPTSMESLEKQPDDPGVWPLLEQDRMVFAYFDGRGGRAPYSVPPLPALSQPGWSRALRFSWKIRIHIQEIAENALDLAHFSVVHHYLEQPLLTRFSVHGNSFNVALSARRKVMGRVTPSEMDITYHGMGVVHSRIETRPVVLHVLLTSTPIDPHHIEVSIVVVYNKTRNPVRNAAIRVFLKKEISTDFAHDIPIWEAKTYLSQPMLSDNDGPIMRIRRWARQFYGEEVQDGGDAAGEALTSTRPGASGSAQPGRLSA